MSQYGEVVLLDGENLDRLELVSSSFHALAFFLEVVGSGNANIALARGLCIGLFRRTQAVTGKLSGTLTIWQQEFVDRFLSQSHSRSLLIAAPGTGKTRTALVTAHQLLASQAIDSVLVISDAVVLREQWRHAASQYGIQLANTFRDHHSGGTAGFSTTARALISKEPAAAIRAAEFSNRWFIVVDSDAYEREPVMLLIEKMLGGNAESRALFISNRVPEGLAYETEFRFQSESIVERSIIEIPATANRIARFSPSFFTALGTAKWCCRD